MTRPFRPVVPSTTVPVVGQGGRPTMEYQRFFNALVSASQSVEPITIGASPYTYTASIIGTLFVSGGTVSDITIRRGTVTVPTGVLAGPIPLTNGDIATVTYSVAPTVNFVPA